MSHKYDNFNSAFSDFAGQFATVKQKLDWAFQNAHEAYIIAEDPVDKTAFGYACYAIECVVAAMRFMGDYTEANYAQSHFYESVYWANKDAPEPPEFELTWKKICEAWAENDFEGRAVTIAFIDRMRQLLWNEPFYVAWAAKPSVPE